MKTTSWACLHNPHKLRLWPVIYRISYELTHPITPEVLTIGLDQVAWVQLHQKTITFQICNNPEICRISQLKIPTVQTIYQISDILPIS
jgi:hypothetical protein